MAILHIILTCLFAVIFITNAKKLTENELSALLNTFNEESVDLCRSTTLASWNVATDVGNTTKENEKAQKIVEYANFERKWYDEHWRNLSLDDYKNETIRRQIYFLKNLQTAVLPPSRLNFLTKTITKMTSIYNKATICPYEKPNCNETERLTLDPHITERFAKSRNYDELLHLWTEWHDASGKKIRSNYMDYVMVMNEVAKGNNYDNAALYWKSIFEIDDFEQLVDDLWLKLKPLYDELHKYMRFKLMEIYGGKIDRNKTTIPAHLLGNMWAQSWSNLYEDTKPFQNGTSSIDVTAKLIELKYDPLRMFRVSDEFYQSLGLESNEMSYTGESIIEKPKDRIIQCHASAWDFCDGKDFRIKMCTNVNQADLFTIHHEMGHIQYYIQYKHLPLTLRGGANPGFHEAIGDTMALSVANPQHLTKIGLLNSYNDSFENTINSLYAQALNRFAFLPFGLLIDKWRWDVFSEKTVEADWNKRWWELREFYQKISPPIDRTEDDFDAGAKYHVPADSKYISYFISHILEFQFYKSLCIEAGEYKPNDNSTKPLHACDFYGSKMAGTKLANGMKLGMSKHWHEALEQITGDKNITVDAILEYFKPLHEFLIKENIKLTEEDNVRQKLEEFDKEASKLNYKLQLAKWDMNTDLNNKTKESIHTEIVKENAQFRKEQDEYFKTLNPNDYADEKIQRQILYVKNLETDKLDEEKLAKLTSVKAEMLKVYNNAKFCEYSKPNCSENEKLTLDPEITDIMAKSRDFDTLNYTWTMWHDSTGPYMLDNYETYINLSNEAAKLNGFSDYGELWRSKYEDDRFREKMENIWKEIEPFYDDLHAYTRRKLLEIYGDKMNESDPLIPAHLLGNMWAQTWVNLYEDIKPFKNSSDIDITEALKRENYTALKIFETADEFYQSLGLEPNNMSYTGKSIIEKPKDRLIVCHASAWDIGDGKDFRIKQCTTVDHRNFITAHHEMGHIQYYILYKDQPILFRAGANPGFHEAVGDLIALSVSTPKHLEKIGLLKNYKDTDEDNINSLFKMALERVAFLPFGLLMDLYRFDLFSGKVEKNNWNSHWETLREKYQKIRSPVKRSSLHFDAGAKFHTPYDYSYSAYFFAHILEFQLLKSTCIAAGQYEPNNPNKPLHKCDIQGSLAAGKLIRNGLSLGLSKHWSETLSIMTNGETELSADAILEYFKPLREFLQAQNSNSSFWHQKFPYLAGGFIILVCAIAVISYGIFYVNRK